MSIFYKDQRLAHMSKGDSYLWSKFLDKYTDFFYKVIYDVKVGKSVKLPTGYPEWLVKSAESLSRKRIDVVGYRGKYVFIVEVRVRAKPDVLGTLLSYKHLYELLYRPSKPVYPMLVTDSLEADLLVSLKELRIPFFIV